MGKIIGEVFKDYVKNQIDTRQEKLGELQHDDNFHLWTIGSKPWIRVCSSVNVDETKLAELGLPSTYNGNELAKKYILYGGVSSLDENNQLKLKGGLASNFNSTDLNTFNAYGFNSSPEFGFSPMPSVTSINITPQNRGSLTKASIKINCHNVDQFNIIETLYLRLKYTILIEWGHSVYYNNDGELITTPTDTVFTKFLNNEKGRFTRLKEIEETRKNSCGNYDGFMGWVTNFSWAFNEHGGYDVELDAITYGDVIESLKAPVSYPNAKNTIQGIPTIASFPPTNPSVGTQTVLGKVLDEFKETMSTIGGNINGKDITATQINTTYKLGINKVQNKGDVVDNEVIQVIERTTDIGVEPFYYLKLGTLLRILQNLCFLNDGDGDSICQFDIDYSNTYCFNPSKLALSLNPQICLIPSKIPPIINTWEDYIYDTSFLNEEDELKSKTLHIYLNFNFVLDCLNKNINTQDNILSVNDFLSSIFTGINNSLGNVTNLSLTYDDIQNKYFVIDENLPVPESTPTKFNIIKLKEGSGSFITKSSIKSLLSPNFAKQIAIGAQASNSGNVDNESLAFSNWNKGLEDRIIPSKTTSENPSSTTQKEFENNYSELTIAIDNKYLREGIEGLKPTYLNVVKLSSPSKVFSSFIPIDLSLEMKGLSGMKIFQKYSIIDKYLPQNYRNNIEFIIKGITHSINEKEWTTTINGLSIPKPKSSTSYKIPDNPPPPADKGDGIQSLTPGVIRLRLTRLVDDGTSTVGYMEIFDENGTRVQVVSTLERSWTNNTKSESSIPRGTWVAKSDNGSKATHQPTFRIGLMREDGTFTQSWSYNNIKRNGILIHGGTWLPEHSQGCILVGIGIKIRNNGVGEGKINSYKNQPTNIDTGKGKSRIFGSTYNLWQKLGNLYGMEIVNAGGVADGALPKEFTNLTKAELERVGLTVDWNPPGRS